MLAPIMNSALQTSARKAPEPVEQAASVGVIEALGIEPLSLSHWAMDRSSVTVVRITATLSLLASCGPGHPESRSFYAAHAPTICAEPGSVIFWDLSALLSTNLSVVTTMVGVGKANRHEIAQLHMFYRSPLVGMAVTVSNVALGGLIQLYREAEPFHAALREAAG